VDDVVLVQLLHTVDDFVQQLGDESFVSRESAIGGVDLLQPLEITQFEVRFYYVDIVFLNEDDVGVGDVGVVQGGQDGHVRADLFNDRCVAVRDFLFFDGNEFFLSICNSFGFVNGC